MNQIFSTFSNLPQVWRICTYSQFFVRPCPVRLNYPDFREPGLPEMFASIEHNANSAIALKVICQSRPASSIGNATVSAGHGACCCIVNNKIGITCQTTYLSEASCLDICNEWEDYWSSLWVIVPDSGTKC